MATLFRPHWLLCLYCPLALAAPLALPTDARQSLHLTVYQQDLAVLRDARTLKGYDGKAAAIAFEGISATVVPETCVLDGVRVREQALRDDSGSLEALLRHHQGRSVYVHSAEAGAAGRRETVTVLRAGPEPLLQRADGSLSLGLLPGEAWLFPAAAQLPVQPIWTARIEGRAAPVLALSCQLHGLSWSADYVATLNAAENRLRLTALATVHNRTGVDFPRSQLSLLAGQPRLVADAAGTPKLARAMVMMAESDGLPEAATVADHTVYAIEGPVSLAAGESRQLALLDAAAVPVRKQYLHGGRLAQPLPAERVRAQVRYEFDNSPAAGLGRALPQGIVRFHKADARGQLQFVGASPMGPAASGEPVRLVTGEAFAVSLDKQVSAPRRNPANNRQQLDVAYRIYNSQAVEATVIVEEQGWRQQLVAATPAATQTGPWAWRWQITVAAGQTASLSYTVEELRGDE